MNETGTSRFRARQGPTLEAPSIFPWLMYVPLGDLSNCKRFPFRATVCALGIALPVRKPGIHLPPYANTVNYSLGWSLEI